jgi:dephospho-CoA kinase
MLRVGLTGGIGAGKSEVSRRLAAQGAVVLDADAVAREVVEPGSARPFSPTRPCAPG